MAQELSPSEYPKPSPSIWATLLVLIIFGLIAFLILVGAGAMLQRVGVI